MNLKFNRINKQSYPKVSIKVCKRWVVTLATFQLISLDTSIIKNPNQDRKARRNQRLLGIQNDLTLIQQLHTSAQR